MFSGLTSINTSANKEQPVYVDIYYISPSSVGTFFDRFCNHLVVDINETETGGRTFKYTKYYPLDWKLNLNKMSNDQFNNLKKYNKLEFKN